MTLSLDIDDLLSRVTYRASLITGIRKAFDYDQWPDSPPALPRENQAYHLTGFLEDGAFLTYTDRGSDLSEWELPLELFTVVVESAQVLRARQWIAPFPERYAAAFRENLYLPMDGTYGIDAGGAMYQGCTVIEGVGAKWPGWAGFYVLRHRLVIHTKGAVSKSVGTP